jgi:hypothetical protein
MATNPTLTTRILTETAYEVVVVMTGSFVDTQETANLKVDADLLGGGGVIPGATPLLNIRKVKWSCSGSGIIKVLFDASVPVLALQLGGSIGDLDMTDGPLTNNAGSGVTGDILFTTLGFGSGDTYEVLMTLDKSLGTYTTRPIVTALTIEDAHSGTYNTGDTFKVQATFNQNVNYEGTPYIELALPSGTVRALVDRSNPTISMHATGPSTAYAVFQYTFTAADGANATDFVLGAIAGISGTHAGGLPVVNSLPALSGITAFTVNKDLPVVTTTNSHHYVSDDHIDLTVTYTTAVDVATGGGTPTIPLTITSGNKNASYLSGTGTRVLTFRYTPVVSGDVASAAGVSVGSPIALNSGTITDHNTGRAASLIFTPPTTSTVSIN